MKVIACIPAHNEERNIAKVLLKTKKHVDYIITCDDGSTDYTANLAKYFSNQVLNHNVKLGYGRSLIDLFREALKHKPKVIVTLDSDGQHDPDEIPKLINPILNGKADIVVGSRFLSSKNETKKYRLFGIKTINLLTRKASGNPINDSQCGFRAYSQHALQKLHLTEDGMGISTEILLKASEEDLRIVEVPVHVHYVGLKTSKQNPVSQASNVITAIIRRVVEREPIKYFGVPALVSLIITTFFSIRTLDHYTTTGILITNLAIASMFSFMFFVFLMNMAITLYALSRIRLEIEGSK